MSICINHLQRKHIYKIMEWRNAQMQWLRQEKELTVEEQEQWFNEYLDGLDSYCPKNYLYAIYKDNEFIGYGGLVHIDWDKMQAEVSFLLNSSIKRYWVIYGEFMELLKKQVVRKLGLKKLTSETWVERKRHMVMLEMNGWRRVSVKHEMVIE